MNGKDSKLDYAKDFVKRAQTPSPVSEQVQLIMNTMAKYGTNHWWESKDERILAYWQVNEPMLIIPWVIFQRGLENLLGRKVEDKEYAYLVSNLKIEAEKKYQELIKRKTIIF